VLSAFFTPFANSFLLAAASEFGDKSQLLSASLNLRFGRPWKILAAATLASASNHFVVALLGRWIGFHLDQKIVDVVATALFVFLAALTLFSSNLRFQSDSKPESRANDGKEPPRHLTYSFLGVFFILFLAEMGDKTQIVTGVLSAKYHSNWATLAIVLGSSLGTILPDAAAIFVTQRLGNALHWRQLRYLSAGAFLASAAFVGLKL
jgi:Ca2+/H+ antiporter, TMEM165/GDT1 family